MPFSKDLLTVLFKSIANSSRPLEEWNYVLLATDFYVKNKAYPIQTM